MTDVETPLNLFMERFLELLKSDEALHDGAVDLLHAHAEAQREKAAWYRAKTQAVSVKPGTHVPILNTAGGNYP